MGDNKCQICNNKSCNCNRHLNFSVQKAGGQIDRLIPQIRIGNDIKLDVTIHELNGMQIINIKSIKCIITNANPVLKDGCGNAYEIHRCGMPTYHIIPTCEYHGFGIYPYGPKNWHHNLYPHYDYSCHNPYGRHYLKPIQPKFNQSEFIAPVKALPEPNKVQVFFPANAQLLCGLYNITFVIELYEPGYHTNNLRTVTADYNNAFELVSNSWGQSGDITIDMDRQLGLNTIDDNMFGNIVNNNTTIQNISIYEPVTSLAVGQSAWYRTYSDGQHIQNTNWEVIGASAVPVIQSNGDVLVKGVSVENVVEGWDEVNVHATCGNASDNVFVRIHNYTVGIGLDGIFGDSINLGSNPITTSIYVMQEDGTRISMCEQGCECQACPVGKVDVINGGELIELSQVEDEDDGCKDGKCNCKPVKFMIKNINTTGQAGIAKIQLTSNTKDSTGNFVTKTITIIVGKDSASSGSTSGNGNQGGNNTTPGADVYVNGGNYNATSGTLYLNRTDGSNVSINGFPTEQDRQYWYDGRSN